MLPLWTFCKPGCQNGVAVKVERGHGEAKVSIMAGSSTPRAISVAKSSGSCAPLVRMARSTRGSLAGGTVTPGSAAGRLSLEMTSGRPPIQARLARPGTGGERRSHRPRTGRRRSAGGGERGQVYGVRRREPGFPPVTAKSERVIQPEDICEPEWAAWYRLTPEERWEKSQAMWADFLALGGSLDPEPDTQSPFFNAQEWRQSAAHGRSSVRIVRRGGV